MDVEALLAKARALRVEAESAENNLRESVLEKKSVKNKEIDGNIDDLFFSGVEPIDKLRDNRLATDCLVGIVQRLYEREMIAKGLDHVEAIASKTDNVDFEVVSTTDDEEVVRLEGLIDKLVETASTLDEEYHATQNKRGLKDKTTNWSHYTEGNLESNLRSKANDIRREHSEQFKKREQAHNEAFRPIDSKDSGRGKGS